MKTATVNAERCVVCRKADYGENQGLEKVEHCARCASPVCVRCQGKCCALVAAEENKHIRA